MDQPAAGLNSAAKVAAGDLIEKLRDRGMTILLFEHDMPLCEERQVIKAVR